MRFALHLVFSVLLLSGCAPQMAAPPPAATAVAAVSASPQPGAARATPTLGQILLDDDFTRLDAERWVMWGRPQPSVQGEAPGKGQGAYLVLSAIEPRYEGGITSKAEIPFLSGASIRLSAHVPAEWQERDAWLVLDWDPRPEVEAARIQEGAIIRLLLLPGSVTLYTRETDLECNIPLDTRQPHTYTLQLGELFEAGLWIDQAAEPACLHDYTDRIFEIARTGPLTLTGAGWVTHIEAGR